MSPVYTTGLSPIAGTGVRSLSDADIAQNTGAAERLCDAARDIDGGLAFDGAIDAYAKELKDMGDRLREIACNLEEAREALR